MCNFNVKNVSTKCLLSLNKTWKVSEYISTIIEKQVSIKTTTVYFPCLVS
jgi:hypothetical protein